MKQYATYIRVSTTKQDLGLEAQQNIINNYIKPTDVILATFCEKESGRNNNRVELLKAIEYCLSNDCILLIAKLDRLSRNVAFISALMESKVKFHAIDIPNMDKFSIHIFAALAEREVGMIRERTQATMNIIKESIKANGFYMSKAGNKITKLGKDSIADEYRLMGQQAIKIKKETNPNLIKAKAFAKALKDGGKNYAYITKALNDNGFRTSTGKEYLHTSTRRLFE